MNVRDTPTKTLKQVMGEMFESYKLSGKMHEKQVVNAWPRIMGPTIAKRTGKKFLKNGVLYVSINSAPLKNDLSLSKEKIIYLFEQEFGSGVLEDIRFI